MKYRSNGLRWFSALLLFLMLAVGSGVAVSAQEDNLGTPAATPATEADGGISIGDESTTAIGEETSTPTEVPVTDTQDSTAEPATETPTSDAGAGIGDDSGADVSTGEGTPAAEETPTESPTDEATPTPTSTPDETVAPASVGVSVTVYLCAAGYGGGVPSGDANCAPASGVSIAVFADDNPLGIFATNGSGIVSVDAPEGSEVAFSQLPESLPSGYVPDGNGIVFATAESGASTWIANIQVETAGRLQISNGLCPTSGEARTQFIVVGPLAVQSSALGCEPRAGAALTITGPGGTYSAVTDPQGNWIGTLPVGTYTVSNENGFQAVDVEVSSTTILIVVDFVPGPKGTLTIERYDCSEGSEGTTIQLDGAPNNQSCIPSDKSVSVSASGGDAAPLVIDLGEDGTSSVDVAAGDYVVTDGPSTKSEDVHVAEGASVKVTINSTILTGSVSASMFWCGSSASASVDPSQWGNWTTRCGTAGAGLTVSLLDGNGNVIATASTGANGTLSFSSLVPGRYSLTAEGGCALFANGADARNGFDLAAGDAVELAAFGCEEPASVPEQPTDPGSGPGTIGSNDGTGSNGGVIGNGGDGGFVGNSPIGGAGYHTRNLAVNPLAGVSTLPATGEGANPVNDQLLLMLLGLAALAAGAALSVTSNRGKRSV